MTQEEKQLLLKVLCTMLPYGVKCAFRSKDGYIPSTILRVDVENELVLFANRPDIQKDKSTSYLNLTEHIKPYLRPMSSMTEYEKEEYDKTFDWDYSIQGTPFDWLNEHHFDYRGLIEKGLALEAPEGMYKTE